MRGPDVQYGGVTLLASPEGGRYPSGNSLLISGTDRTVLVDPSIEVHRRGGLTDAVDLVAISHAHEDHLAGLHLFADLPVLAHPAEVGAVRSPEVLLAGYGPGPHEAGVFREQLRDTFHLSARTGPGHRRWRRPGTTWPAGSAHRPRSPAH
jgi:glyoxylase-like metal-dependent hydrolase (beta-lactamase superfamily II)